MKKKPNKSSKYIQKTLKEHRKYYEEFLSAISVRRINKKKEN